MVDVRARSAPTKQGCSQLPACGLDVSKKEMCAQHAENGVCTYPSSITRPSWVGLGRKCRGWCKAQTGGCGKYDVEAPERVSRQQREWT